ncbi:hypothetical protein [Pseudomonas gorinensis]|uniref:hypothetical protein n=1 Tax=Pseudomonas gorinensis TaxID=3240790 RepID=UPI00206AE19C|nr:MAG TPA: hypothetical protein [Caudoviricetes sp.]
MKKIAYLDISPRMTGKTARLVKLAQAQLDLGRKVCFVTIRGVVPEIQKVLPHALVVEDGKPFPAGLNADAYTWFYDEFDWLKNVKVRPGGYYATTARFLRKLGDCSSKDDTLLQLIQAAGGRFERFYWPSDAEVDVKEWRAFYAPDDFRRLCLGEVFA